MDAGMLSCVLHSEPLQFMSSKAWFGSGNTRTPRAPFFSEFCTWGVTWTTVRLCSQFVKHPKAKLEGRTLKFLGGAFYFLFHDRVQMSDIFLDNSLIAWQTFIRQGFREIEEKTATNLCKVWTLNALHWNEGKFTIYRIHKRAGIAGISNKRHFQMSVFCERVWRRQPIIACI